MSDIIKRFARRIVRSEQEGLRTHKAVMRLLAKARPAGSLLDVGCGDGSKASLYSEFLGLPPGSVKGVEAQEEYASRARKKFEVHTVDLETSSLPFPDESFGLVVCNQVLEHLKNIFRPLAEMDRVVKTGGYLLIGVPNLAGLYNRMRLLAGRQPLANAIDGPHVRGFAHRDFLEFLRRNGNFTVEALGSSNLYPLPYPLLEALEGRFVSLSCFTFYLLRKKTHDPGACGWRPGQTDDTRF